MVMVVDDNSMSDTTPLQLPIIGVLGNVIFPNCLMRMVIRKQKKGIPLLDSFINNESADKSVHAAVFPVLDADFEKYVDEKRLIDVEGRKWFHVGCISHILNVTRIELTEEIPEYTYSVLFRGLTRCRILSTVPIDDKSHELLALRQGTVAPFELDALQPSQNAKFLDNMRKAARLLLAVTRPTITLSFELLLTNENVSVTALADVIAGTLDKIPFYKRLNILDAASASDQIAMVNALIREQITQRVNSNPLRSGLGGPGFGSDSAIPPLVSRRRWGDLNKRAAAPGGGRGSGGRWQDQDDGDKDDDLYELKESFKKKKLPPLVQSAVDREMKRIQKMQPSSPEYTVSRTYLEVLAEIPWSVTTEGNVSLERAKTQLDEDHYGLADVKQHIYQYIAVHALSKLKSRDSTVHQDTDNGNDSSHQLRGGDADGSHDTSSRGNEELSRPDFEAVTEDDMREDETNATGADRDDNEGGRKSIVPSSGIDHAHANPRRRNKYVAPTILCLVGPPGVGKTSLGRSIAAALGRRFERIALGGVHDEAEIRGHRRTYIGAMPGNIAQALRKAGCMNPVILLDEVDKLGTNARGGDPSAALLEVLDPDQNNSFVDNYLAVPMDLSQVVFIATANRADVISPPLLDRMELIQLAGYTLDEKVSIASKHLVPKQVRAAFLEPEEDIVFLPSTLSAIASGYTREAGVRHLERKIATVCRHVAAEVVTSMEASSTAVEKRSATVAASQVVISPEMVEKILGGPKYVNEAAMRTSLPGVSTGMAWTPTGGELLFIESCGFSGASEGRGIKSSSGRTTITGNMGEVMQESCTIALSWIRDNISALEDRFGSEAAYAHSKNRTGDSLRSRVFTSDVHIHVPAGAISKDGPSAGCAIVTSLVSMFTGRTVDPLLSMTGEITLRGLVLPVGGVKEKVLAAHSGGIRRVILPAKNEKDVEKIANLEGLQILFVNHIDEVLDIAFSDPDKGWSALDPRSEGADRTDRHTSAIVFNPPAKSGLRQQQQTAAAATAAASPAVTPVSRANPESTAICSDVAHVAVVPLLRSFL